MIQRAMTYQSGLFREIGIPKTAFVSKGGNRVMRYLPCSLRNGYYGEQWATLMHRELGQWIAEHAGQPHDQDAASSESPEVEDGEEMVCVPRLPPQARISNLVEIIHHL